VSPSLQNKPLIPPSLNIIYVLIVTYKSSRKIAETLTHLDLINKDHLSLVVSLVDCSGEYAAIKDIAEQFTDLSTTVYDSSKNIGYAGGNNFLINELVHKKIFGSSNNDLLLVLNPDINLSIDVLLAMVTVHQYMPKAFAVSPCEESYAAYCTDETVSARIRKLGGKDFTGHKAMFSQIHDINIVDTIAHCTGACLLIKASILANYNLRFSEDFFMYMEETKLLLDAVNLGYHSYAILNKTILHDTQSDRFNPLKCYYTSRNAVKLAKSLKRSDLLYYYLARFAKPSILLGSFFLITRRVECIIASIHGFIDGFVGKSGIELLYHRTT
jgi:GT2 family glycosyltransferase